MSIVTDALLGLAVRGRHLGYHDAISCANNIMIHDVFHDVPYRSVVLKVSSCMQITHDRLFLAV